MHLEHRSDSPLAAEVRKAGSQTAFAKKIGRSQSTIHGWLRLDRVPAEEVGDVASRLGVTPEYLRPDLAELFQTPPPPRATRGDSPAGAGAPKARPAGDPAPSTNQVPSGREGSAPAAVAPSAAGVTNRREARA